MLIPVVVATSALAMVLTVALVREVRFRRALQALLIRLLKHWRQHDPHDKEARP